MTQHRILLPDGKAQSVDHLVVEVAYEHWHRMLFARFLAENNLLMYPDPDDPVAVTLEECEDLAADEGATKIKTDRFGFFTTENH